MNRTHLMAVFVVVGSEVICTFIGCDRIDRPCYEVSLNCGIFGNCNNGIYIDIEIWHFHLLLSSF